MLASDSRVATAQLATTSRRMDTAESTTMRRFFMVSFMTVARMLGRAAERVKVVSRTGVRTMAGAVAGVEPLAPRLSAPDI